MNGRTPGISLETVPFVGVMQEIWRHEGNITILFCGVGVEFIPLFCDEPQTVVMRMRANAVGKTFALNFAKCIHETQVAPKEFLCKKRHCSRLKPFKSTIVYHEVQLTVDCAYIQYVFRNP